MRENIAGALGASEQILAVIGIEKFAERLDPVNHHQKIVLTVQREYGIDEIVPRALLAELDFQTISEERETLECHRRSMRHKRDIQRVSDGRPRSSPSFNTFADILRCLGQRNL